MRYLTAVMMILAMVAVLAYATDPPTNPVATPPLPSYWGYDCGNWVGYWNAITTPELCWRWASGSNPQGYYNCGTGQLYEWPVAKIDLFVEMEVQVHYDWTLAQVHRASDYSDIVLDLHGWASGNCGNYIIMAPHPGNDLNNLEGMTSVYGPVGADIPLTYLYWNGNAYVPMIEDPAGWYLLVPASYQEFWIRIIGDVAFHQPDGWYTTQIVLCPMAEL